MGGRLKSIRAGKIQKNPDFNVVRIKTESNSLGLLKVGLSILFILLQFGILLLLHLYFVTLTKYYLISSAVISILTAVYIISSNKNSYSKAVWILFVLVFFLFGWFIYFLADERLFFYRPKKKYNKIFDESKDKVKTNTQISNFPVDVQRTCELLKNAGNFPTFDKTKLKYYSSGASFFDDVLEDIKQAKEFIFMEFFIISDGVLLSRFLHILEKKVKEGVEVKIIYDDLGSSKAFSLKTKKRMKNLGIKLGKFNPLIERFSMAINYRDHRKIIDIDGKVAYTGGINLADEYINEKRMHGYWKDSGIRLEGAAVNEFTLIFLRQWCYVSNENIEFDNYLNREEKQENDSAVVVYADGLDYPNQVAKDAYLSMISSASQKVYIMTPYFILDDALTDLLISKAMAGVDVRIILPEVADKKMVYKVSRSNAERLLPYGVKLYLMKDSFVHSKMILTDDGVVVGSINFDVRSFYQQFEAAVFTNDPAIMKDVKHDFVMTIKESRQITNENADENKFINRFIAGILRIISPLM